MGNMEVSTDSERSMFSRMWTNTPIVIKAILVGFIVNTIGVGAWVLALNFIPFPWTILVMAVILWAYVRYFSGNWGPVSTIELRKEYFRAIRFSKFNWKWGLLSAVLLILVFQSGMMITFRLMEYPAEVFKSEYNLDSMPVWAAWVGLIMASIVAGICEETGFRGYMQVPLEKRYGPKVAIFIVSVVFVVVHLHQAWAWPILFQIFLAGVFSGILAYRSNSLIPGIIAHTGLDIFNFSYWWSDVLGKFDKIPVFESGIDAHFLTWLFVFCISLILFFRTSSRGNSI